MDVDVRTRRPFAVSAAVALAGGLTCIAGVVLAPDAIAVSYLVAYIATVAVAVGTLLLVMIAHVSKATWFVVLRRQAEAVLGALPLLAILALPLVVVPRAFWPWAAPFETLSPSMQEALRPKLTYFQPAFFAVRAVVYWVAWLSAGELLRRVSRRQDTGSDSGAPERLRIASIAGLPLVGLTLTFASFDWMMSLSPGWSSSVYGVYYFAGAMVSALALIALLAGGRPVPGTDAAVSAEHLHALGKLTLAFVLFWGYIWYSQFFIIWIADIPNEAEWYIVRLRGGWGILGSAVVAAGFALPLLVLLIRLAKRSFAVMAALGAWLLAVHYLDVYWLLVPPHRPEWPIIYLLWDAAALAFVAGSATAVAIWRQAPAPPVPIGDPQLRESLRYEAR